MTTQTNSRQILEFRSDERTINVQGTREGLAWLAQKCLVLVDSGRKNHLHLDDYYVLTAGSKAAVLELLPQHCSKAESLINKTTKFVRPDFSEGHLEFRDNPQEVHIYGTVEGLRWLAQKCLVLVDGCRETHFDLGGYQVLTKGSKPVKLAQFPAMTITSVTQIGDLLDLVHDRWFNVERVVLDKEHKVVALHLEVKKVDLAKGSKTGIRLLIKNAESLTINDTEQVRDYDLNEIKFDAASSRVIITGGIPITIEVKVGQLELEAVSNTV